MTQEQQYLNITLAELETLFKYIQHDTHVRYIYEAVCSRPVHTIEQQLIEARQQEREKMLDELDNWLQSQIDGSGDAGDYVVQSVFTDVQIKIAELRNPPAHKEDEPEQLGSLPSPPGDTIKDIMEERGISRLKLGILLGICEDSLSMLLNGSFLIDNDMACRLSDSLGSTPQFWEERERQYRELLQELRSQQGGKRDDPHRNYRCEHCEIRNGVKFCHYHDAPTHQQQSVDDVLDQLTEARREVLAILDNLNVKIDSLACQSEICCRDYCSSLVSDAINTIRNLPAHKEQP